MMRDGYKVFSEGKIGKLSLINRLVRSSTAEPIGRCMTAVLNNYKQLAEGGVGPARFKRKRRLLC